MSKKLKQTWIGYCEDNRLYGTLSIEGGIKHTSETDSILVRYNVTFNGESLAEVMQIDTASNVKVRMATLRELPYEEVIVKRDQLQGATVAWKDISSWTTKGQRGRKSLDKMSGQEILGKMSQAQIIEMLAEAKRQGIELE